MAEDEATFGDIRDAVVEVVRVEHQHAAFAFAEILGPGAAGVDHSVDRHQAVGGGVRVIVADVEIEIAGGAEVGRNGSVEDEVQIRSAVRTEVDHTIIAGILVADHETPELQGGESTALQAGGPDVGRGGGHVETPRAILSVHATEESGGDVEADLSRPKDDLTARAEAERAVDAGLQDAARPDGDRSGETLRFRDIDDAVGIITVVLIRRADDQREGPAQDVGAGDREGAAGVAVATETESRGGATGRRQGRAGEHGITIIGAEPGLDVGRDRPDLPGEIGLEIIESAEGDRHAAGLPALVVRDEEIEPAAEEVAPRSGERTERDAGAGAVTRAERERGRGVIVLILENDELSGADAGRRLHAQAGAGVDLDVVAGDVRPGGAGAGEPELAFLDHGTAGVGLRIREPEDAAAAADKSAVRDVSGDEADGAAAGGGGVTVEADMPGVAAEVEAVGQGDGMRGVAAVQGEDARIEERRPPHDRLSGAAEINVDGRAVGAEARASAAEETDLPRTGAERTGEIDVILIDRLLGLRPAEHQVGGGERRGRRAGADDVAQVAFAEIGRPGVGRRREKRGQARRRLDEGDGVRAVVRDDGGDRMGIPGEVVEMIIAFSPGRQERDADDVGAAAGEQAAGGDDEGGVGGAEDRPGAGTLQIQRADGRRTGA